MIQKLLPGKRYQIKRFTKAISQSYRFKLLAMGLIPGAQFSVVRLAPLGNTLEVCLNEFKLSLRVKELSQLDIEAI